MIFLTSSDFDGTLNAQLKKILITDNTQINQAEGFAMAEIKEYLAGRFDVPTIFSMSGSSRHPIIVLYMINLTIYQAQKLISPQNIPHWVKDGKDAAMQWLKLVASNDLNPELPLIPGQKPSGTMRFGGNTKLTMRI